MGSRDIGLLVALIGVATVAIGILIATGLMSWFGRLPGDIRIQRDGVAIYIPITSMLILSVALSLLAWGLRKVF